MGEVQVVDGTTNLIIDSLAFSHSSVLYIYFFSRKAVSLMRF